MTELHVLRVFVGPDGRGGNPLGVFLDGADVPAERRQEMATRLGFSETVWLAEGGRSLPVLPPRPDVPS
jgi:predicted PhzF superfamily epimerase YddE/YHI9